MSTEITHNWFPDGLPDDLLGLDHVDLLHALERPTLVRVPGRGRAAPRAVACLLHGDEATGLEAVLHVMQRRRTYDFDLYVVVGNVQAALAEPGFAHRYLDGQEDFNRIWGVDDPTNMQRLAADGILAHLLEAQVEALVDVHNNTGDNPFYAIVTTTDAKELNLATLFTTTLLNWNLDAHTLMEGLPPEVASIAVECGQQGLPESLAFAIDGLRRFLGETSLRDDRVIRDYEMLGNLRKVTVRPEVRFSFGGALSDDIDYVIGPDADIHNFVEVEAGHVLGHVHRGAALPIRATEPHGDDVTHDYFAVDDGAVVTTVPVTPVMMTRTVEAARKDCLFYLSDRLDPPTL